MSPAAQKIEQEFEKLSTEEMMALHEQLIVSIQERAERAGLDPAFKATVERRVEEIRSGKARGVDAFDALDRT